MSPLKSLWLANAFLGGLFSCLCSMFAMVVLGGSIAIKPSIFALFFCVGFVAAAIAFPLFLYIKRWKHGDGFSMFLYGPFCAFIAGLCLMLPGAVDLMSIDEHFFKKMLHAINTAAFISLISAPISIGLGILLSVFNNHFLNKASA